MTLNETLQNITNTINAKSEKNHSDIMWSIERTISDTFSNLVNNKYYINNNIDHHEIRVSLMGVNTSAYMFTLKVKLVKGTSEYHTWSGTTQYYTIKSITCEDEDKGDLEIAQLASDAIASIKKQAEWKNNYIAELYNKIATWGLDADEAYRLANSIKSNWYELKKYEESLQK